MPVEQTIAVNDADKRFERTEPPHIPYFVAGPGARSGDRAAATPAGPAPAAPALGAGRVRAVLAAALVAGLAVIAVQLASDHQDARVVWAIFGPAVGWSFVGTGLYAWRRRPDSRTGALMVLLGFAWFLFTLDAANSRLVYTFALVFGGLWGGVFLHLGLAFPTGRLPAAIDRALAISGYVIFPLAFVPALLFAGPRELGCDGCPTNLLLIDRDPGLASALTAFGALIYVVLFTIVLVRAIGPGLTRFGLKNALPDPLNNPTPRPAVVSKKAVASTFELLSKTLSMPNSSR